MSTSKHVSTTPPPPREEFAELLPTATWIRIAVSWGVVVGVALFGHTFLTEPMANGPAIAGFLVLFATILYAAFGVVHEADHLAHKLGEPYGTLILTLAIVGIEVILIAAVMLGPGEAATIGRDSIFAVMMIILNLVTGICLLLGGLRYGEQEYNSQGAIAYLSMIALLTGIALVVPNFLSTGDGTFLPIQAIAIATFVVILYGGFLAMQMRGYRRFFVQPALGSLSIPVEPPRDVAAGPVPDERPALDRRAILVRSLTLVVLVLPIVLLAHDMAILIDFGVQTVGAPVAVGGVVIAIIVFTPESLTAVRAAMANEMQRAINLCLGAFVSTVGLTVPAVIAVGLITGNTVVMGLSPLDTVLLVVTVALSLMTFLGLRTSPVQGMMHLALFAIYAVLLFVP